MSYTAQAQLASDAEFQSRCTACVVEQAEVFKDDARQDFVALAQCVLRGDGELTLAFIRLFASAPGIADKATTADGIDSSLVSDGDLLSLTQANWQVVAWLYFDETGAPK